MKARIDSPELCLNPEEVFEKTCRFADKCGAMLVQQIQRTAHEGPIRSSPRPFQPVRPPIPHQVLDPTCSYGYGESLVSPRRKTDGRENENKKRILSLANGMLSSLPWMLAVESKVPCRIGPGVSRLDRWRQSGSSPRSRSPPRGYPDRPSGPTRSKQY